MKLLLATTNQGKAAEIKSLLSGFPLEIFPLQKLGLTQTYPEKGKTFRENARGKSLFFSQKWKGLTLAEDSGLEVASLGGAPGVLSARFSGPGANDKRNIAKLLHLMEEVSGNERKARFVCSMVLSKQATIIWESEEHVEGVIMASPKGKFGFGYDPIFYYPPLNKTFAEMWPEDKNKVSHRGQALQKMKEFLWGYLALHQKA